MHVCARTCVHACLCAHVTVCASCLSPVCMYFYLCFKTAYLCVKGGGGGSGLLACTCVCVRARVF